jgi:hypothetical protein
VDRRLTTPVMTRPVALPMHDGIMREVLADVEAPPGLAGPDVPLGAPGHRRESGARHRASD